MTKRNNLIWWFSSGVCFALFFALIAGVKLYDVEQLGPDCHAIGFATINRAVRDFFDVNNVWYELTEWLAYAAFAVAAGFAIFGLFQLIKGKSLKRVDIDIWLLGAFYVVVTVVYVIFEVVVINYRPILIDGELEASFPSSHTMLVLSIMGTAIYQLWKRIRATGIRIIAVSLCGVVAAITAFGRLASGVHWTTDIVGGILISCALVFSYIGTCQAMEK